jgi:probable H4MPT-linked C1 transfer pathway protein
MADGIPDASATAPAGGGDVLAFDVGGANVKAADGRGWAASEPFELWRRRAELPAALARIAAARRPRRIVATMTGEIADCYGSRREGVADIVAAVAAAAAAAGADPSATGIYLVDGSIVPPAAAVARPLAAAAANWHAVARLAAAAGAAGRAFLLDVGSTTTDIVPLVDGRPAPLASDDVGRLSSGELVYTGVERTPVAALVRRLPWRGRLRPVASERFADAADAWLILGGVDGATAATADGGPATPPAAARRLARMLLADPDDVTPAEARLLAEACARSQARLVAAALTRVSSAVGWRPERIVLSGHGGCLARMAIVRTGWRPGLVELADSLGAGVARVAPAHALALVALGRLP